MSAVAKLAWKSLINRKATAILTIMTVAISVILLLGVERIRTQAKDSFANTISGTDLIIGGRSGQVNLLLYSVFRIGNATNNIDWKSYQEFANHRAVDWAIPISLGDSHKGFRVMGTNHSYFEHYKFGSKQSLTFSEGRKFNGLFETVLGSDVAKQLGYHVGSEIIIAHGISDVGFSRHDNLPFKVVGILAPTGTPVDKTVHVSLEAIEAIHVGWESGARLGPTPKAQDLKNRDFQPKQITAMLVGLKSRIQTFALQRQINTYPKEPLSAIMPGVALHELWGMMSVAEQALMAVSGFVVIAGLLGMLSSLLTSLQERRREMAILRAMGARPRHVFSLLISEASLLTAAGIVTGVAGLYAILAIVQPIIQQHYGIHLTLSLLSPYEWMLLGFVQCAGIVIGFIPAFRAYRQSLSDGMTIRI
ncbi:MULTISPECIES: ABC transporter permease [Vibrio diabolicus subgroup]|jgi:putative ABC transport system permease protein|uniref:Peptide ABC transporter permease n=3 Tax=Vibrio diabolicus subgroup TaxID=2315253 RepID=A0ABM6SAD7_9VIBR|nr:MULTISPECIES: ABC transporter permease [Vibrio diabolicus subgroup]MCR9672282.1 ABC transporter permease [Vibrio alginolyticus]MEA3483709.1 ABC transporter permease [Pseudomonadota bacterium]ACY49864.1 ABC-type antimicrobial peptide transport system permease component [Vibrio antiquarius]AVH27186.1 peptide ABC transporter permease [Vibrio diabolicus]EDN56296.1 efflux ABC transporter, permease protein [Vibrio antiquarius]